jgi:hypothetical protein
MNMVRTACGVCAAATMLVGAGCGSSSSSSSSSSTPASAPPPATTTAASTTAATTSTPATTTSASTGATSTGGATAPGTKLAMGATATVPYKDPGADVGNKPAPYKVQVTIQSLKKASLSDFNGIKLDAQQKASTPYYVKATITNVGNGDPGKADPAVAIEGVDTTGQTQQSVTFFGDFPPCNSTEAPKPFTRGKSWSTCLVFLVPGGITAVAYTGPPDDYISKPVTWK